ncbi:CBS domain-containing protein CBSX3, mitochondrial-like isoform X2 [Aristolochia californica]
MQGLSRAVAIFGHAVLPTYSKGRVLRPERLSRFRCALSNPTDVNKGLASTTVADILKSKGDMDPSLLWCQTDDTVYEAVKHMTQNNVGSLAVVKPGVQKLIAGIITERDYLKKIIVQGRSSKTTQVGEIMTEENRLITVTSDTSILQAMQLMIENNIRHAPVIDGKIVGMISIVDVIRVVMEQQHEEMRHLNDLIKGKYY